MKKIICLIFLLIACLKTNNSREIEIENIFLQKEKTYYVLVYLDSCLACRNTKLFVLEQEKRNNYRVYFIDFLTCDFDQDLQQNNLLINNYQEINVNKVPTIFLIESRQISRELIGYKDIIKYY